MPEKISCLQEAVPLLNQCIGKENQGQLQNYKKLKILAIHFKKQMKENKSLTLKLCQKKEKFEKLNRKDVFSNCLKSENVELRYELAENLENREQTTRFQKCIAD